MSRYTRIRASVPGKSSYIRNRAVMIGIEQIYQEKIRYTRKIACVPGIPRKE